MNDDLKPLDLSEIKRLSEEQNEDDRLVSAVKQALGDDNAEVRTEVFNITDPDELPEVMRRIRAGMGPRQEPEPEEDPLTDLEKAEAHMSMLHLAHRMLDGAMSVTNMRREELVMGMMMTADRLMELVKEFGKIEVEEAAED